MLVGFFISCIGLQNSFEVRVGAAGNNRSTPIHSSATAVRVHLKPFCHQDQEQSHCKQPGWSLSSLLLMHTYPSGAQQEVNNSSSDEAICCAFLHTHPSGIFLPAKTASIADNSPAVPTQSRLKIGFQHAGKHPVAQWWLNTPSLLIRCFHLGPGICVSCGRRGGTRMETGKENNPVIGSSSW